MEITVMRNTQTSLWCNCFNCKYGIKRSDFHLEEHLATAYSYMCELDEEETKCYQPTACCKHWKEKKEV